MSAIGGYRDARLHLAALEVAIALLCASFLGRELPVPAWAARATSHALMFGGLLALMLGAGHH